jgi:hypothetical protein
MVALLSEHLISQPLFNGLCRLTKRSPQRRCLWLGVRRWHIICPRGVQSVPRASCYSLFPERYRSVFAVLVNSVTLKEFFHVKTDKATLSAKCLTVTSTGPNLNHGTIPANLGLSMKPNLTGFLGVFFKDFFNSNYSETARQYWEPCLETGSIIDPNDPSTVTAADSGKRIPYCSLVVPIRHRHVPP